jgi:signal transduction histidine kinase
VTDLSGDLAPLGAERLGALLDAFVTVGEASDLTPTLERIVAVAVEYVGARYGALGVIGRDGLLERFLHVGVDPDSAAAIGELPRGRGVLGVLTRDPRPLRLRNVRDHGESVGFPPHHPSMRSFLGVPVRSRGRVFGNLYLTEKQGGGEFTAADEAVVVALASAAGTAVENARLLGTTARRAERERAGREITTAVLSGEPVEDVLQLIADRARDLCTADDALVLLPRRDGRLVAEVASGAGAEKLRGLEVGAADPVMGVVSTRRPLVHDGGEAAGMLALRGPGVCVPLVSDGRPLGALAVVRAPGAAPFPDGTPRLLTVFGEQAALALVLGQAAEDRRTLAVHQDRERIARDLHDLVIQRIYATGMGLQAVRGSVPPPAARRIDATVHDLDQTIAEIRSAIFALETPAHQVPAGLRARVLAEAREAVVALGFEPGVSLVGPVDSTVPDDMADAVVAAVREALSNVARHAGATGVHVSLRVGEDVELTVVDDGRGPGPLERRSGLRNLDARARAWGGRCVVEPASPRGTQLRWTTPLPR